MSYGTRVNVKIGQTSEKARQLLDHMKPMWGAGKAFGDMPNFRGVPVSYYADSSTGDLSGEYARMFKDAAEKKAIRYVFYSYHTPIAWLMLDPVTVQLKWVQPDVKYSSSTTQHQSFVRRVLGGW